MQAHSELEPAMAFVVTLQYVCTPQFTRSGRKSNETAQSSGAAALGVRARFRSSRSNAAFSSLLCAVYTTSEGRRKDLKGMLPRVPAVMEFTSMGLTFTIAVTRTTVFT